LLALVLLASPLLSAVATELDSVKPPTAAGTAAVDEQQSLLESEEHGPEESAAEGCCCQGCAPGGCTGMMHNECSPCNPNCNTFSYKLGCNAGHLVPDGSSPEKCSWYHGETTQAPAVEVAAAVDEQPDLLEKEEEHVAEESAAEGCCCQGCAPGGCTGMMHNECSPCNPNCNTFSYKLGCKAGHLVPHGTSPDKCSWYHGETTQAPAVEVAVAVDQQQDLLEKEEEHILAATEEGAAEGCCCQGCAPGGCTGMMHNECSPCNPSCNTFSYKLGCDSGHLVPDGSSPDKCSWYHGEITI